MRCPDCKKQVDTVMDCCPYCGATLPQEQREFEKQEVQPLNIQRIVKSNGIGIVASAVLTLFCFLVWRIAIANIQASMFGGNTKTALNETVSIMLGRIIILLILGMIGYSLFLVLTRKTDKRVVICIVTIVLCVIGLLLFYPTTHRTAYDEISASVIYYSRGLMFVYGLGIPLLQGALCLSLSNRKNTIKNVAFTLLAFVIGIVVGTVVGTRMIYLGRSTLGFGLIYSLLGAVAAYIVSILLNWRETQ